MRLDLWNAAFRSSVVAYASSGNLDVRRGDRSRSVGLDGLDGLVGANPYPRIGRRLARGGRARTESLTSSPPGTRSLPERETILSFMVSRVESSRGAGDSGRGQGLEGEPTPAGRNAQARHSKASVWFLTMDDSALVDRLRSSPPSRATPGCSWYRGSSPRAPPPGPPCPRPPPCPAPARRTRPGT